MDPIPAELDNWYFSLVGAYLDTVCLARNAEGYACTEEPGHDGWHRAELDHGEVDTWPQDES